MLPALMNTMVVNVMNGSLHASIVALEGYCSFHRLLLLFVQKYPSLQKLIDDRALAFVRYAPQKKKKSSVFFLSFFFFLFLFYFCSSFFLLLLVLSSFSSSYY